MLEPSSINEQSRIAQLEALLSERTAEVEAHARRIRLLEEALRVLQADKYGASREKLGVAPGQRGLFNEAEATIELTEAATLARGACGAAPAAGGAAAQRAA